MRAGKYLTERNIGLDSLNSLCDFLNLNHVKMTSHLSEEKVALLDANLEAQSFLGWLKLKLPLDGIEINEAMNIIKPLFYNSTIQIDELMGERILNGLSCLINKHFYSKAKESLTQILYSNKSTLEKILLLKLAEPFVKPKKSFVSKIKKAKKSSINDYDPYENFHWGGLHGEEAYIGYWNTD
jgi:hypothetical protein